MTLLVTGATGFVGRRLVATLQARGQSLRLLVRDPSQFAPAKDTDIVQGSLTGAALPASLGEGIAGILHLAGSLFPRRSSDFMRINRDGTLSLAQQMAHSCPEAVWIQISSVAATGPGNPVTDGSPPCPVSCYGRSKLAGEAAVLEAFPGRVTILRPPAVYGPGDAAFRSLFQMVHRGWPCPVPALDAAAFSLIHVDDLVAAILAALERGAAGKVHHVAGPESLLLRDFPARIGQALERPSRVLGVPSLGLWGLAAVLAPFRWLTGRPHSFSLDKVRELTAGSWVCSAQGAEEALAWRANQDLHEGLRETARSYGFLPQNA